MAEVFIASSAEGIAYAKELQNKLNESFFKEKLSHEAVLWCDSGVFLPGSFTLDALMHKADELQKNDGYALVLCTPDDKIRIKRNGESRTYMIPRDNVIFELGLFMQALGKKRCLFLMPKNRRDMKSLSDLSGLTYVPYEFGKGTKDHFSSSIGDVLRSIRGIS